MSSQPWLLKVLECTCSGRTCHVHLQGQRISWADGRQSHLALMLVSCSTYCLTLKMEAAGSCDMSVFGSLLYCIVSQEINLFKYFFLLLSQPVIELGISLYIMLKMFMESVICECSVSAFVPQSTSFLDRQMCCIISSIKHVEVTVDSCRRLTLTEISNFNDAIILIYRELSTAVSETIFCCVWWILTSQAHGLTSLFCPLDYNIRVSGCEP